MVSDTSIVRVSHHSSMASTTINARTYDKRTLTNLPITDKLNYSISQSALSDSNQNLSNLNIGSESYRIEYASMGRAALDIINQT